MVIKLYSEKNNQSEKDLGLIQNLVSRGLTEGQFSSTNVKMNVIKADSVGDKFRNAVKKAKNAQYLNDADLVVVFQTKDEAPEAPEADEKEQAPEEAVSESVKVQDLSKSVGLKPVSPKNPSCGCKCGKKTVKEEEEKKPSGKKPSSKKDLEKKASGKRQAPEEEPEKDSEEKEPVGEAQVQATGDALRAKISDTIRRTLYLPKEEDVELVSLEDYLPGYDVFFTKLSFKD